MSGSPGSPDALGAPGVPGAPDAHCAHSLPRPGGKGGLRGVVVVVVMVMVMVTGRVQFLSKQSNDGHCERRWARHDGAGQGRPGQSCAAESAVRYE